MAAVHRESMAARTHRWRADHQHRSCARWVGRTHTDLFEGELTDDDKLVYVNNVIKGKLLESEVLAEQARNNTKAQFASSPNLDSELLNAIIEAFEAHQVMSKQALDSDKVRAGMKSILLGPAGLYESFRSRSTS